MSDASEEKLGGQLPTYIVRVPVIHYYDVEVDMNGHAWENEDGTNDADTFDIATYVEDYESWPKEPSDVQIGELQIPEPGEPMELPGRIWWTEISRAISHGGYTGEVHVYGVGYERFEYDSVNDAIRAHAAMPERKAVS